MSAYDAAVLRAAALTGTTIALLLPAAAIAKPTISIDTKYHDTRDRVVAFISPGRAAPSGWHYVTYFISENQDADETGCAYFAKKSTFFGKKNFSVAFRPRSAVTPASRWCDGRARISLFIERNSNPEQTKARVASQRMYFSD